MTTIKLLDANVTLAKLAADCVDGTKIAAGAVDAAALASDAVTTGKLLDDAVTQAKVDQTSVTSLSALATVGTIATGTWQGTAVGNAYLNCGVQSLTVSADSNMDMQDGTSLTATAFNGSMHCIVTVGGALDITGGRTLALPDVDVGGQKLELVVRNGSSGGTITVVAPSGVHTLAGTTPIVAVFAEDRHYLFVASSSTEWTYVSSFQII